jgi:predicted transcriptional regulator
MGGMWQLLIGMFIRGASSGSYQQLMIKESFKGEHVRDFMKTDPVTVPPDTTVHQLVNDYIYQYHYKMFPVTDDGKLLGCVTTADIKKIAREKWDEKVVEDILSPCSEENSVTEDTDATKALTIMNQSGNSRLIVLENGELAGIITLKDMLDFFSLKIDLEGE